MIRIYLLTFVLLFSSALQAQEQCKYQLQGKVLDFHDGTPLKQAKILNKNNGSIYTTNDKGQFLITNLCKQRYTFIVSHPDCDSEEVTIAMDSNQQVSWALEHHRIALEALEKTGEIAKKTMIVPEEHLHTKELEKYATTSVGEAITELTGVSALETGNAIIKPMIHGLHSSRVVMYNNGVRQEDMEWGVEHAPNMDINAYDHISVIKGSGALRYGGDAIAGVVLAEYPLLPRDKEFRGSLNLTGISNGRGGAASINVAKGLGSGWGIGTQASYTRNGDFNTPDYILSNTGAEQKAFRLEFGKNTFKNKVKLSYSAFYKKMGIMTASHFGTLTDLAQAIAAPQPITIRDFTYDIAKPYQEIQHHLAKAYYEYRIQHFGKIEAQYAFQYNHRYEYDNRRGEVKQTPSMDVQLKTHSTELVLTIDSPKHLKIESGLSAGYQNNYSSPQTQVKRLIPDYDKYNAALFANAQYSLQEVAISAGLRYDYISLFAKKYYRKKLWKERNYDTYFHQNIIGDYSNEWLVKFHKVYHNFSAVLGINYIPNKLNNLSLSYALASRAPNPSEIFSEGLHHSASAIEIGDVLLTPETSHRINIGLQRRFDLLKGITLNANAYYNRINNFIYQVPRGLENTIRGAFQVLDYKQINAEMWGADIEVELSIHPEFNYKNKIAYVYANDISHDYPLINMPPLQWNQELKWQGNTIKYSPYVQFNARYTANQSRYPNYNFTVHDVFIDNQRTDMNIEVSTPPPSYWIFDFETGLQTQWIAKSLNFNFSVKNIFNQKYRNYLNRYRYFADEIGRQLQIQAIIEF